MPSELEISYRRYVESRLLGLRDTRYSWWAHAREVADFILPRRYRWLITPNQWNRGSPINQHILDSTGTIAARNLSSGLASGISSPIRPWFKLKIGMIDSTQTGPVSLWLAEVERRMFLVFHESDFYDSIAVVYFDLVVFGTAVILVYEDFDNVIRCFNPCFGEYYLDLDGKYRPCIFYREFTLTVYAVVDEFGLENCSDAVQNLWKQPGGSGRSREIVVAHAIEPNDPSRTGIPDRFKFVEVYWEWGGSTNPQSGTTAQGFLRRKGYFEQCAVAFRWDLVGNDAYGRSPGMDALADVKQLQHETRRKAQGLDKSVNPPMVADMQLKNAPASMLPGGVTYVSGMMQTGKSGFEPAYGNWKPDISAMSEDLKEVRERIKKTFYNDVLQTMAQLRAQTSSNVTAAEIDATKAESLIMLGPVLGRIGGGLSLIIDRTFAVMNRAGLIPPAPQEVQGAGIQIEWKSILAIAQEAAAATGIERTLAVGGNLAAMDPAVMDGIDTDYALAKYANLMQNDPKMLRSPTQLAAIRKQRAEQQAMERQAALAEQMAAGAKTLSETEVGGGRNALQQMIGV